MPILTIFMQCLGIAVLLTLVYGVPLYFIWREETVAEREKYIWMVACMIMPWLPFIVFAFAAPVSNLQDQ